MIYAVAIILVAMVAILVLLGRYADEIRVWCQYQEDKRMLQDANRAGDLNAIRYYAARVREYRLKTGREG